MKNLLEELEELETKDPLEKCLFILRYFLHNDNKDVNVLRLLYNNGYDLDEIVGDFKKYLSSNLFKYETIQAKQDYVKYIIYQFHEFSSFIERQNWRMAVLAYEVYEGLQVDQKTKNIIHAWFFFVDIMDEIQESCFILNLDFLTLCSELYISSETFVPKMALVIREKMNLIREKKQEFKIKSLSWTGNKVQLEKLWQALKAAGYIDPSIDFKSITAIFSDELTGCKAIKWKASNRLLSYLFNQMYASNLIAKEWQTIIGKYRLFQNKSGKYLTAQDLSTALSETNTKDLNPIGYEKIDEILKNLKDA